MLKGSCNCKAVTFTIDGHAQNAAGCHCGQCRKQSGHFWASDHAPVKNIHITGEVRWFSSSDTARRGFCPNCGSFLFWKLNAEDGMSFSLGAIDGPTGLRLTRHIFTADKGDYYDIPDTVRQKETEHE